MDNVFHHNKIWRHFWFYSLGSMTLWWWTQKNKKVPEELGFARVPESFFRLLVWWRRYIFQTKVVHVVVNWSIFHENESICRLMLLWFEKLTTFSSGDIILSFSVFQRLGSGNFKLYSDLVYSDVFHRSLPSVAL